MILLENVNVVIRDQLLEQLQSLQDQSIKKCSLCDIKCADFDGVEYFLFNNQNDTSSFCLALRSPAAKALLAAGGVAILQQVYGGAVTQPFDRQWDCQLTFSLNGISPQENAAFCDKMAAFKAHLYAAPITERMQAAIQKQVIGPIADIPIKSSSERMFVKQDGTDRLTVIFSIDFSDPDDAVFGRAFLNEFPNVKPPGAPTASFTPNAVPLELRNHPNLPQSGNPKNKNPIAYLSLVVYDRHWSGAKLQDAAFTVITFRDYLHYHIKCCKSYLHTRMRMKVEQLLRILNRARHDAPKEKKTAKGRTFTRK